MAVCSFPEVPVAGHQVSQIDFSIRNESGKPLGERTLG